MPGAPGYESARKPAAARFHDTRPRAIVLCKSAGDVAETLAFARRSGVHVAPRSGGHCFAGRSSTAGIVIDVTPMDAVSVSDGVATVGAGTRLADLYDALDEHDLTLPAGCGPTVGIAGLTLGGGVRDPRAANTGSPAIDCSPRRSSSPTGASSTATRATTRTCSGRCAGAGGGQFGVVTSLAFDCVPATAATTFHLVWPHAAAAAVIEAWQHWAPDAPDRLNASLRLAAAGDPDDAPVTHLFGAMRGDESGTVELLEQLVARVGVAPDAASHQHLGFRAAKQALVGLGSVEEADPDRPGPMFSRSEFFRRPLPADAIGALVGMLGPGRVRGESRELNLTPWGGAYNRVAPDATAFAHRDERFIVEHVLVADHGAPAVGRRWVQRSWATVHRWGSGRVYPNFPDPDLADWAEGLPRRQLRAPAPRQAGVRPGRRPALRRPVALNPGPPRKERQTMHPITIQALENGPYRVDAPIRPIDPDGGEFAVAADAAVYLCRCGSSRKKPFCDGTHARIGFEAAERAPGQPPAR